MCRQRQSRKKKYLKRGENAKELGCQVRKTTLEKKKGILPGGEREGGAGTRRIPNIGSIERRRENR